MGFLIFQAVAYVQSPRLAGGVRSDVLFAMLDGLRAAELPMAAYPGASRPSRARRARRRPWRHHRRRPSCPD